MFKHILIPTDGSPIAIKAVRAGIRFAHEIGAKVTAYQAIGTLLTHIDEEGYVVDPKMHDAFERTARETAMKNCQATCRKCVTAAGFQPPDMPGNVHKKMPSVRNGAWPTTSSQDFV